MKPLYVCRLGLLAFSFSTTILAEMPMPPVAAPAGQTAPQPMGPPAPPPENPQGGVTPGQVALGGAIATGAAVAAGVAVTTGLNNGLPSKSPQVGTVPQGPSGPPMVGNALTGLSAAGSMDSTSQVGTVPAPPMDTTGPEGWAKEPDTVPQWQKDAVASGDRGAIKIASETRMKTEAALYALEDARANPDPALNAKAQQEALDVLEALYEEAKAESDAASEAAQGAWDRLKLARTTSPKVVLQEAFNALPAKVAAEASEQLGEIAAKKLRKVAIGAVLKSTRRVLLKAVAYLTPVWGVVEAGSDFHENIQGTLGNSDLNFCNSELGGMSCTHLALGFHGYLSNLATDMKCSQDQIRFRIEDHCSEKCQAMVETPKRYDPMEIGEACGDTGSRNCAAGFTGQTEVMACAFGNGVPGDMKGPWMSVNSYLYSTVSGHVNAWGLGSHIQCDVAPLKMTYQTQRKELARCASGTPNSAMKYCTPSGEYDRRNLTKPEGACGETYNEVVEMKSEVFKGFPRKWMTSTIGLPDLFEYIEITDIDSGQRVTRSVLGLSDKDIREFCWEKMGAKISAAYENIPKEKSKATVVEGCYSNSGYQPGGFVAPSASSSANGPVMGPAF